MDVCVRARLLACSLAHVRVCHTPAPVTTLALLRSSSQMPTDAPDDRLTEQEEAAKVGAASSASSPPLCVRMCVCSICRAGA